MKITKNLEIGIGRVSGDWVELIPTIAVRHKYFYLYEIEIGWFTEDIIMWLTYKFKPANT